MASKLMVTAHMNETSSHTRSRNRPTGTGRDVAYSTNGDGAIYPNNSRGRIKTFNEDGQGPMYPLSSIETRVDAHQKSSSEEQIIKPGQQDLDDNPFREDTKGGISKTVEFEFHETTVHGT